MATAVYELEEIELQDGTIAVLKPLNIKKLRNFMKVAKNLEEQQEDEDAMLDTLIELCVIALDKDKEQLEEAIDIPTAWKVLEVCGGIKRGDGDPNL